MDGRLPFGREADDGTIVLRPPEMLFPLVTTRVEEGHQFARRRITGTARSPLVAVASWGQVRRGGRPAAYLRDAMLAVEGSVESFIRVPAILAQPAGTPPDPITELPGHGRN
jgi:hypothetical protein